MSRLPTPYKRTYLRVLAEDNRILGEPFPDTLMTVARKSIELTREGSIVLGTSGNGHSVTFAPPAAGQGTVMDHAELIDELFTLYETALANLVSAGTAEPTTAQIVTEMLGLFLPVTESVNDYSCLSRV